MSTLAAELLLLSQLTPRHPTLRVLPCKACPPLDSIGCIISWPLCEACWLSCSQTPTELTITIHPEGYPTHCSWTLAKDEQIFTGGSINCDPIILPMPEPGTWTFTLIAHYAHEGENGELYTFELVKELKIGGEDE